MAVSELVTQTEALRHGHSADGARWVREGFSFTSHDDLAFALGWPHFAVLYDGHPDDADPQPAALDALEDHRLDTRSAWPRQVALRLARALFLPSPFTDQFVGRPPRSVPRESTLEVLSNPEPIRPSEGERLLNEMWDNYPAIARPSAVRVLEAFVGPELIAETILGRLNALSASEACMHAPGLRDVLEHVGLMLLRLPSELAQRYRHQWRESYDRWMTDGIQETETFIPPLVVASRNVLGIDEGRAAYVPWFILDDPQKIVDLTGSTLDEREWCLPQDPRLVFLGGDNAYELELRVWSKHGNRMFPKAKAHAETVERFGRIRSPCTVRLMTEMASTSKAKRQAKHWLKAHADYVKEVGL